jgi:hypothetical protein
MDPTLMSDEQLLRRIRTEWVKWRIHKSYYPETIMWWVCMHPLLRTLLLPGIKIGRRMHSVPVVAYVDDITVS